MEYFFRIWTADLLHPEKSYPAAILGFVISFYGVVDLMTILPFFLSFFVPSGAIAFRMLRVVLILRLFKINSRYDAFNVITEVIKDKKNALVSSIFMMLVLMMAIAIAFLGVGVTAISVHRVLQC